MGSQCILYIHHFFLLGLHGNTLKIKYHTKRTEIRSKQLAASLKLLSICHVVGIRGGMLFCKRTRRFFVLCMEDNYNSTAANTSTEQVARVGNRTYYLSLPPLYSPSLIHTAVLAKCLLLACVLKENFLIRKYQIMKKSYRKCHIQTTHFALHLLKRLCSCP